ncbi:Oligoendopeptidase F [Clostridiaceae bacterium JG1575]|nr:Oligoendopeptidase F [Clostridiaceae bacterium JG1575]
MKQVKKRSAIAKSDQWNLEAIYPDQERYEQDVQRVKERIAAFPRWRGTLGEAKNVRSFLNDQEETERLLTKVCVYAHLRMTEDMGDDWRQSLNLQATSLRTQYASASAFVDPELLSLPEATFQAILQEEALAPWRFYLEKKRSLKDHVLSDGEESVLASLGEVRRCPQNAASIYTNAELKFPHVLDSSGQAHELTNGNFVNLMRSKDRTLRQNAFRELHETYGRSSKTLAQLLMTNMKDWAVEAKLRHFTNSVEKALKPNNIPTQVFYQAIEGIHRHLPLMHRYVALKREILGYETLRYSDLYVSVGDAGSESYSFQEAVDMAKVGLAPMGKDYIEAFCQGIDAGWIDKYENVGKRAGAFSSGAYDTMPFILLNYEGSLGNVSTFVHEMGHSMHSYYTRKNQPYAYGNYSIFLAEVASTCNEKLLIHHLISTTQDPAMRIALIHQELEQIRTTVYRQLMFAEFEKITHEGIEAGNQYSAGDLDRIWMDLNRRYYGDEIFLDEALAHEWARIPHFYNDFYVYQYATGYAAASSFARMILEQGQDAADRYINCFLKAGSSKYPVDVLKDAGVDMTSPQPLEDTLSRFRELMDLLEEEVQK